MGSGSSNQNQVQSYDSNEKKVQSESGPVQLQVQKTNSSNDKPLRTKSANKARIPDKSNSSISQTMIKSLDTASLEGSASRTKLPALPTASKVPITNVHKVDKEEGENLPMKMKQLEAEKMDKVKGEDLSMKIKQLEKELATGESKKLDLQEKVQLLEERLDDVQSRKPSDTNNDSQTLKETLLAKDQCILKLEKDSQTAQCEANKLRIKLKKRIRGLTNQLQEARQEASITQMELRGEINRLNDKLKEHDEKESPSPGEEGGSHSKIIVELSNQLSEQSEQLSNLTEQLSQKDRRIEELEAIIQKSNKSSTSHVEAGQNNNTEQYRNLSSTSTDRLHSSRGLRSFNPADSEVVRDQTKGALSAGQNAVNPQPLERQSTALSDSDSDWEVDSVPSHTRSAPARSRVKSAFSTSNSENHKGSLVTLNGDDDTIIETMSKSPLGHHAGSRQQMQRKSALKSHLEKNKNAKQSHSLMGPSLAFVNKTDQFSDTSCEPTPRYPDSGFSSHTRVKTVKPVNH